MYFEVPICIYAHKQAGIHCTLTIPGKGLLQLKGQQSGIWRPDGERNIVESKYTLVMCTCGLGKANHCLRFVAHKHAEKDIALFLSQTFDSLSTLCPRKHFACILLVSCKGGTLHSEATVHDALFLVCSNKILV